MSILGIESAIFAVDDMAENTRFWSDFGLPLVSSSAAEAVFELASGSKVILLNHGDPRLPAVDPFKGNGVKETIWGVDTAENLKKLVAGLATDRVVTHDADGTAHCVADDGQPIHPAISSG
jgi:catechol 2,3-dioxygenase-like lactoylglutathione lyase family enzyme